MLKKLLPIILCFVLAFSTCISAETVADEATQEMPAATEEMPQQGRGGGMPGGGGHGGPGGGRPGGGAPPDGTNMQAPPDENMQPPEMPAEGSTPQGESVRSPENSGNMNADSNTSSSDSTAVPDGESANQPQMQGRGGMQGGFPGEMPQQNQAGNDTAAETTEAADSGGILSFIKTYQTPVISLILLALAFVFVKFYKRTMY